MAEVLMNESNEYIINDLEVEKRFCDIVDYIKQTEEFLTSEQKHELEIAPQAKAAGTSDQGYRYN